MGGGGFPQTRLFFYPFGALMLRGNGIQIRQHLQVRSSVHICIYYQPTFRPYYNQVCIWITPNILIGDSCLTAVLLSRLNYHFSCFEKILVHFYKYVIIQKQTINPSIEKQYLSEAFRHISFWDFTSGLESFLILLILYKVFQVRNL